MFDSLRKAAIQQFVQIVWGKKIKRIVASKGFDIFRQNETNKQFGLNWLFTGSLGNTI